MSETSSNIAVIGLGAMGLPMATHLATAFSVRALTRSSRVGSSPSSVAS